MNNLYKKSLIISSFDDLKNPVYAGGGAVSVHEIARRFAKSYRVTVLTGTYPGAKNTSINGVSYIRTGTSLFGYKTGQLIFQLALLKHAVLGDYDVWIEAAMPPFTFSLLPLAVKRPVISWVNMLASYDMKRKYKLNFRLVEQQLAKLYRFFIVPTTWVQKEILTMNKNANIITIPYGFEHYSVNYSKTKKNSQKKYVLFIGRIEVDQKGLDLLLQALSLTKKDISLIIAGSGAAKEERVLHALAKRYGIEEKIIFTGRVGGKQKAALFTHAHATIIPSRFETFSLTALESIAYQKPVICFNIPQLAWIPKAFAVKVKPFDVRQLIMTLDAVAEGRIKSFGKKEAREFLKKFNWDNIALQFETAMISKVI